MGSVLITGVSGFIGQALATRLLKSGYTVHGMYEHESSFSKNDNNVVKHVANLINYKTVDCLIHDIKPDFVFHLAAKTEVALSFDNYCKVSEVNYCGTINLAEANRLYNPNLKLFIMASTMETYGQHEPLEGAFTEETEQKPMAPYAVAKLACEYYLKYMKESYRFPFTVLRQTNTYGRHDNDFFIVERIITQMLRSKVCRLGVAYPYRNFLYIDDLIDLYESVLDNCEKVKGEFFVVGPANAITIGELAETIKNKLKWNGEIIWGVQAKRPGEINYLNSNPIKAKQLLGWEPKVNLSDGLDKTIDLWKKRIQ